MPPSIKERSTLPAVDRTWETAVQNINGMISILTLLPVLTGRAQNVKLVASRLLPASFVVTGIGAGRVLVKLQTGILLCSFDLYRNIVGEISYPHDEYVNRYSPLLNHIPTGTPERHATGTYINHNPAEVYMVEAWFRSQGRPATVELHFNNTWRMMTAYALYLCLYASEAFLATHNAATGCAMIFLALQSASVCLWLAATTIIQSRKGQGKKSLSLNDTTSLAYRCFRVSSLGSNVLSAILSFNLDNLDGYQVFQSRYQQPPLVIAGSLILISGLIDILSTVLVVGLTWWAYYWLAIELLIIVAKVAFCVEPFRFTEIERVHSLTTQDIVGLPQDKSMRVPLDIRFDKRWECLTVTTHHNVLLDRDTGSKWKSTSAGVSIGQQYEVVDSKDGVVKYLAFVGSESRLGLVDDHPSIERNQALQREFLAATCAVVEANKIPSKEFIAAVELLMANVKQGMAESWYNFGSKDLSLAVAKAKANIAWRRWL